MKGRIKLADAARRLGCHIETLRLRIRAGELVATRGPHGAYYVTPKDLSALPKPGERRVAPRPPRPTAEQINESWDQLEHYLEKTRLGLTRELRLLRKVRADPGAHRKLYRVVAVNRLGRAGMNFGDIADELGISTRQVRRLAEKRPLDALRRDLATIRSGRQALLDARKMVDTLRKRLEAEGFRYHRLPLAISRRRRRWPFRRMVDEDAEPAHKVKGLTADERRALRRAGLSEQQIDAISVVGMGADEIHELMLRGIGH